MKSKNCQKWPEGWILSFMSFVLLVVLHSALPAASDGSANLDKMEIMKKASGLQIPFIENQGQINNKDVRFYANTFAGTVYVTNKGEIVYGLLKATPGNKTLHQARSGESIEQKQKDVQPDIMGLMIRETVNGSQKPSIRGINEADTKVNYFKGKKEDWKTDIETWHGISLGEIYDNINLSLIAYGNNVEKLFTVHPEGTVSDIKVKIEGARALGINDNGELCIETELGIIKMTKPVAYQEIDGKRIDVAVNYVVLATQHAYGFKVGEYDKTRDLVIDPLLASTFVGPATFEIPYSTQRAFGITPDIAIDSSGNVFVAGTTNSSSYPTTPGAYDTTYNNYEVFVSKFDSTLSLLLSSTFIGGWQTEYVDSIAIDDSDNIVIAGYTFSPYYPVTPGAYETVNSSSAAFISKLNNALNNLLASTFISETERFVGASPRLTYYIAINSSGDIYFTGSARSDKQYPTTPGAFDISHNGWSDIFLSKFDGSLTTLIASTLIGGSSNETATSLAIDNSTNNVFITGTTHSTNYPATPGAYNTTFTQYTNVFVSKFDSSLSFLLASTSIGQVVSGEPTSLALDSYGNVYIAGYFRGSDYPATTGAYDVTFNGGQSDGFISKLDSSLSTLLASTFVGGNDYDFIKDMVINSAGSVIVTGYTKSDDYPTTQDAHSTSLNGNYDISVSAFDSSLSALLYSTYLGKSNKDYGYAIAADNNGGFFIAGFTESLDYPTTPGAYSTACSGNPYCLVISKLDKLLDYDNDGYMSDVDCNDYDALINPGASEVCDGIDNNCDGSVDEGFADADSDGFAVCGGDCNDSDQTVNPGAVEIPYDGKDQDCSGADITDADNDGYDAIAAGGNDCDDRESLANPGAAEVCDGIDNNCDGIIDEGFDADSDNYTTCGGDCNDNDSSINPGTTEICDGTDNNCDGNIDEGFDADSDGYTTCNGDCDDADASVNPGATEVPYNGKDDDCNPATPDDDSDSDGYPSAIDCNDNNPAIHPGAVELCDGADNNCDGNIDETNVDGDSDGYTICGGDCNDSDPLVKPGQTEVQYNSKDDDCSASTPDYSWYMEAVGNGYYDMYGWDNESNIAVDSSYNIHISYMDSTGGLSYTTNAGGSWTTTSLDSTISWWSSMAVDSSGHVHISYVTDNYPNNVLKYVTNKTGSWVIETVDDTGNVYYNSLAVDSSGKVHISYFDSGMLKYVKKDGTWTTPEVVDSDGSVGHYNSIALDSSDNVHISYRDFTNKGLKHASNVTGSWVAETVDSTADDFWHTSIALDSSDRAHISYFEFSAEQVCHWDCWEETTFTLKHAGRNALNSWTIEVLDSATDGYIPNGGTSLVIDSSDNIHIGYQAFIRMKYITNASGSWNSEIASSIIDNVMDVSMANDLSDNVHISTYDYDANSTLYYVSKNPTHIDNDGDGLSEIQGDCNDNNPAANPTAAEVCDGIDNNCNGSIDEGFTDADGDGYAVCAGDCNDGDPLEHPGQRWYMDVDGDGYTNGSMLKQCVRPAGHKAGSELNFMSADCNDSNPAVNPAAAEICDAVDNNCDGTVDEGFDNDSDNYTTCNGDCDDGNPAIHPGTYWYPDIDGDSYGNPAVSLQQCAQPANYVLDNTDCDDYDLNIYPGGPPVRAFGGTDYYPDIQTAYDAAGDGETLQCQDKIFTGTLSLNINKTVVIEGGYDCGYSDNPGITTINGDINITDGEVEIENIVVQ